MPEKAESTAADRYDVLVLDATHKQSLASARSLGRAGLRVALAESYAEHRRGEPVPAFSSRYCHLPVEMPNYGEDPVAYGNAVVDFVRAHGTRVVLPTGDGNIAAIAPYRQALADLGCVLALASDSTLEIACDKDRTLEVARKLDIPAPQSVLVRSLAELPDAYAELGFPFVVKPTLSWTGTADSRLMATLVVNEAEAVEATAGALTPTPGRARRLPRRGRLRSGVPQDQGGPSAADGDQPPASRHDRERRPRRRRLPADDLAVGDRPAGGARRELPHRRQDPVAPR